MQLYYCYLTFLTSLTYMTLTKAFPFLRLLLFFVAPQIGNDNITRITIEVVA